MGIAFFRHMLQIIIQCIVNRMEEASLEAQASWPVQKCHLQSRRLIPATENGMCCRGNGNAGAGDGGYNLHLDSISDTSSWIIPGTPWTCQSTLFNKPFTKQLPPTASSLCLWVGGRAVQWQCSSQCALLTSVPEHG